MVSKCGPAVSKCGTAVFIGKVGGTAVLGYCGFFEPVVWWYCGFLREDWWSCGFGGMDCRSGGFMVGWVEDLVV